ncbi:hypothetical protein NKDENANG_03479 [Candidatus Entotheonellaceae bacterium PAL068K]
MKATRTPRVLLAVLFGVVVASCASVGFRTQGETGPLAWQVTDPKVTRNPNEADFVYTFTLVLREREGRSITFRHLSYIVYPGASVRTFADSKNEADILLVFQPHQERQLSMRYSGSCSESPCAPAQTGWTWVYTLTGTDTEGNAVKSIINMSLSEL